jgi:glycosyltransferase involved in cell wall biosynthesis
MPMASQVRPAGGRPQLYGLVVLSSLSRMKSGATRSIRLAARPLRDLGIDLHFVPARTVLHFLRGFVPGRRLRYDFVLFNGLASISTHSHFGPHLWSIVRALNAPIFLYWHETDWVLDRLGSKDPAAAQRVDRLASQPAVIHLAASTFCSQSIRRRFATARPVAIYECSEVPAPFDRPVRPVEPPLIVNVASIQERKGTDLFVETAIKVCERHPAAEFIWLGEGRIYGTWRADIEATGFQDRILFPGYTDAAYLLLRRASVFFLSSRDDPFPLSNLEAMCLGRSIVAFDVGGVPEALGGHGTLVPPFDSSAAADAILECLGRPPEARIDLEVRRRYLELYTPEKFAERLDNCIRERLTHGN